MHWHIEEKKASGSKTWLLSGLRSRVSFLICYWGASAIKHASIRTKRVLVLLWTGGSISVLLQPLPLWLCPSILLTTTIMILSLWSFNCVLPLAVSLPNIITAYVWPSYFLPSKNQAIGSATTKSSLTDQSTLLSGVVICHLSLSYVLLSVSYPLAQQQQQHSIRVWVSFSDADLFCSTYFIFHP